MCPPDPAAPDCRQCGWKPADEDGFCSDACYHLYKEENRKESAGDGVD